MNTKEQITELLNQHDEIIERASRKFNADRSSLKQAALIGAAKAIATHLQGGSIKSLEGAIYTAAVFSCQDYLREMEVIQLNTYQRQQIKEAGIEKPKACSIEFLPERTTDVMGLDPLLLGLLDELPKRDVIITMAVVVNEEEMRAVGSRYNITGAAAKLVVDKTLEKLKRKLTERDRLAFA